VTSPWAGQLHHESPAYDAPAARIRCTRWGEWAPGSHAGLQLERWPFSWLPWSAAAPPLADRKTRGSGALEPTPFATNGITPCTNSAARRPFPGWHRWRAMQRLSQTVT